MMTSSHPYLTLVSVLCLVFFTACEKNAESGSSVTVVEKGPLVPASAEELREIAEEAYIYGLPLVMNYAVMHDFFIDSTSREFKAPFNQIYNESRVFTYEDTTVITPNSDTPYSSIGFDLRAEPIVLSVPAVAEPRYYSVQLCDSNTFIFGYIGTRSTGRDAGDFLIAGPDWKGDVPAGIKKVFHCSSRFAMAIFRTQLFDAADMTNVKNIQNGYQARTLSAYTGQPAPGSPPAITFPKIDKELAKTRFFEYLDLSLGFSPAGPEEQEIRAKLARIGLGTGEPFSPNHLSNEQREALIAGMQAGQRKVAEKASSLGKNINGWRVGASFGDRDFYRGDWLLRAGAALAGIYGNSADEAMYPMARTTAEGEVLDASKHNYTITFPAGQLPPVNAFWSITMYDGKSQLLIKNPLDRYLINSPMLPKMKSNEDGSLTIYLQRESPGVDKESNWLPAPDGPMYLAMRLYWPKTNAPSILPPGEGTWAPPAIIKNR